jgi:hypothetical protein
VACLFLDATRSSRGCRDRSPSTDVACRRQPHSVACLVALTAGASRVPTSLRFSIGILMLCAFVIMEVSFKRILPGSLAVPGIVLAGAYWIVPKWNSPPPYPWDKTGKEVRLRERLRLRQYHCLTLHNGVDECCAARARRQVKSPFQPALLTSSFHSAN